MKIEQETKDLIRLVNRSPDLGEGWRNVSGMLTTPVTHWASKAPELFQIEPIPDGLKIRLSEEGIIVGKYL